MHRTVSTHHIGFEKDPDEKYGNSGKDGQGYVFKIEAGIPLPGLQVDKQGQTDSRAQGILPSSGIAKHLHKKKPGHKGHYVIDPRFAWMFFVKDRRFFFFRHAHWFKVRAIRVQDMDEIKTYDYEAYCQWLKRAPAPHQAGYLAMYSSLLQGIVTDPRLMQVPVDDHLVHRGDGVFETLKCVEGAIYNLQKHQQRLKRSAARIGIALPGTLEEIEHRIIATIRAGQVRDCLIRVLLARGPGGFAVDPYESIGTQLYIVVYKGKKSFMEAHPQGARVALSDIPGKPSFFSTIKTCNYLPNALMKKQSVDKGVDFVVGQDTDGNITEGPTENLCIVTPNGILVRPPATYMLEGTTMQRGLALAQIFTPVETRSFTASEVSEAREVLIFGTTTNVTAVVEFEGKAIGDGKPGPVFQRLHDVLITEITEVGALRTPVFDG
jgi:branched-chain amino acid aminotransferase